MQAAPEQSKRIEELRARLRDVRERIAAAAARAGRSPGDVALVVVTKTHPSETIEALFAAGHEAVGENRVQEMTGKLDALGGRGEWHFIGHLQRNKVNRVVGRAALIHAVDSVRLIREIEKRAAERGIDQRVLIELNVAGEANKTGAAPEELPAMLEALASATHVKAEGLMTMAPYGANPEDARPHFARLRGIMEAVAASAPFEPRHLSMGMSGDFETGIEEGATIVRVGTGVMGPRMPR